MNGKTKEKERGKLISIWLTLMIIANALSAIIYFFLTPAIIKAFPQVTNWMSYIYGVLALANIVFVIFLFKWKRWAFFAILGVSIAGFVLNIFSGISIIVNILGFIGPLLLYLVLKTKWEYFD